MTNLVQEVQQSILAKRLFCRRQSILVAVSGGLDSVVLLSVLHGLSADQKWKLTVAHFNHQLRGRASDADERFVRKTAERLKLACVTGRADVRQFGRQHGLSLEMAARKLRHAFLAREARRRKIRTIALAHHADDQLELFFVRLLRGAGPEGLAGMKWSNASPADVQITLARPLLGCPKESIREYAAREKIDFRDDATNASHDILRNRIRHELLPLLKKHYQPAIGKTVARVMQMIEAESGFVGWSAAEWRKKSRREAFGRLPLAVQRRVVQQQLIESGLKVDFELVERLRQAANVPVTIDPKRAAFRDVTGRIRSVEIPCVEFVSNQTCLDLKAGEGSVLFDQVKLRWQIKRATERGAFLPKAAPGREYFDADKVGPEIVLRHWRRGDRFQPIGMATSVKLQDLFSNRKAPRALRHRLTVAATTGGDLIWVEGLRISDRFKLDKDTIRRLKWDWQRCA